MFVKDYRKIGDVFKEINKYNLSEYDNPQELYDDILELFIEMFKDENARFDEDKFKEYINRKTDD